MDWIRTNYFQWIAGREKERLDDGKSIWLKGYTELIHVWRNLTHTPALKKFLLAFFFYNMGVQTVMYMATYFASDTLKMETTQLLSVVLIIQLVAILGARLFAFISDKMGNIFALILLVCIWIGICISAYFVQTVTEFYGLSFVLAWSWVAFNPCLDLLILNCCLSPTTPLLILVSMMYVIKLASSLVHFHSVLYRKMGGMRQSTLALMVYFVIGFILLLRLSKKDFAQGA